MLACVLRTENRKDNGRQHCDHRQNGGKPHIANHNAIEHRRDDALAGSGLSNLVGGCGGNVSLQRLIVYQDIRHVLEL